MSKPTGLGEMSSQERDPNLPFMHLLWSDSKMVEFFNREVFPEVWPGHKIASVAQESMTWRPGKRCAAVYELRSDDPAETPPLRTVISFDQDDSKLGDAFADNYGPDFEMSGEGPLPGLFLPDHCCLVEFFPHDCMLPSLANATELGEMLPFIAAALGDGGDPHQWDCQISALRYRPHHRCVLLYSVQTPESDERREVIGKLYRKAAKAKKAFASNLALHEAAAGHSLIIPEPFMFVEELNLVLMECVRGPTMKELFRKTSDNEWMVRTAAAAVATLHSLPYEGGDVRSVQSELTRVRRNAEPLHLVASELAGQLDDVLDRIARLADRLACPRPCVIHGALRPAHLIVVVDDVALIDLDGVGLGDPAFDLAEFMSKCMTQAQISNEDARAGLSEYFLAEYHARVGTDEGLADRVRIICGLTFVTRAIRSFLRAPHRYANEPQSSRPVKYLKEAAACLDRLNG